MKPSNWRLYFDAFVASRISTPFIWGVNDCALFAADCVLATTGQDFAKGDLRGHRTARQALRTLRARGGLYGLATGALGPAVSVGLADEGDVMLVKVGKREALGICSPLGVVLGPSPSGLGSLPMSAAIVCWKVN